MTENEAPREQQFRGWALGPFFGGRIREVTEEDQVRRSRRSAWCWGLALLALAWAAHPVLGVVVTLAAVLVALANWRTR